MVAPARTSEASVETGAPSDSPRRWYVPVRRFTPLPNVPSAVDVVDDSENVVPFTSRAFTSSLSLTLAVSLTFTSYDRPTLTFVDFLLFAFARLLVAVFAAGFAFGLFTFFFRFTLGRFVAVGPFFVALLTAARSLLLLRHRNASWFATILAASWSQDLETCPVLGAIYHRAFFAEMFLLPSTSPLAHRETCPSLDTRDVFSRSRDLSVLKNCCGVAGPA